jgi:DNA-binding transcriptional regulator LsrR (DeoR family)
MSGGREKIEILRASISSLAPNVLITDEITARTLLETADAKTPRIAAKVD